MAKIRIEKVYPHAPAKVWRALTDTGLLARWLMPNDFAPELGRRFTFRTDPAPGFDGTVHCEVLAIEAPHRMVWAWRGGPLDTQVEFRLEPVPAGTRLVMVHSGFRGLRAQLVRLILGFGCRTLYGRRLPQLLAAGEVPPVDTACMSWWQRLLAACTRLLPGSRPRT